MDVVIKAQWVADLRSGEFEQSTGKLESPDGFCCLGVLCHQAAEAGIVERRVGRSGAISYGSSFTKLTEVVQGWAGIADGRGHYVREDDTDGWLTEDNDSLEHSFAEIAETIEKYFLCVSLARRGSQWGIWRSCLNRWS
jgi:hypothetical protein